MVTIIVGCVNLIIVFFNFMEISGLNIPSAVPSTEPQPSNVSSEGRLTSTTSEQTGMSTEQLGSLRNILSRIQVPGNMQTRKLIYLA
jgi:hypothetical protein